MNTRYSLELNASQLPVQAEFEQARERGDALLADLTKASIAGMIANPDNMRTFDLPGSDRQFGMLVHQPEDGDPNKLLIFHSSFAGGKNADSVAEALYMREVVDPSATLMIQMNGSRVGEKSPMNFSDNDRRLLKGRYLAPFVKRTQAVVESIGNPEDQVVFGASQGAAVALAYSGDHDSAAVATAVLDVPTLPLDEPRTFNQLRKNFGSSGKGLKDIMIGNFSDPEWRFAKEMDAQYGLLGTVRQVAGMVRHGKDNLAIPHTLLSQAAESQMFAALGKSDDATLVHSWTTESAVSSLESNLDVHARIRKSFNGERYQGIVARGPHGVALSYEFCAQSSLLARTMRSHAGLRRK